MNVAEITWACSRCGAEFVSRPDLATHLAVDHGCFAAPSAPPIVRPRVRAVPPELSSKGVRRPIGNAWREPRSAAPAAEGRRAAPVVWRPVARPQHSPSPRRATRWVAVAVLCTAVASLALGYRHEAARRQAAAAALSARSAQLYFSDRSRLPTTLSVSRPNSFAFTIANRGGKDTVYEYVVTLASADATSTAARGQVRVAGGRAIRTLVSVTPHRPATSYLITVRLAGRSESIRFAAATR